MMKSISAQLEPGKAAVFALTSQGNVDKVLPEISKFGGQVLQSSLSSEAEQSLREALEQRGAPAPPDAGGRRRRAPRRPRCHDRVGLLFATAFKRSRNPMALVSSDRRVLDVNPALLTLVHRRRADMLGRPVWEFVAGGPLLSKQEWAVEMAEQKFTGETGMITAGGQVVAVQWGADDRGRHRTAARALCRAQHVGLGASFPPGDRRGGARGRAVPARGADRPARRRGQDGTGDRRRAAPRPRHRPHHVRNAMTKLGARSRAHLVAKAMADGHALG